MNRQPLAAVYSPFLDGFFQVVPLSAADFGLCVTLGAVVWGAVEIEKACCAKGTPCQPGRTGTMGGRTLCRHC
jgi:hypothetical protein